MTAMKNWHKRRPPAGARPGTLMIPVEAKPTVIRAIRYSEEEIEEIEIHDPSALERCLGDDRNWWIDVSGLGTEGALRAIADVFSIHPLTLEDVVNVPQRPKTEIFESNQFFVLRMAQYDEEENIELEQMSLFIGRNYVLSIQEHEGDMLDPVRARIRRGGGPIRGRGPDYLAYAIIDMIIDAYFPILEDLGERVDDLEEFVIEDPSPRVVGWINTVRRDLLGLRRAVWPLRDAVASLLREHTTFIADETRVYFRDCYDHCVQLADVIETYRELGSGLMNTYLSSIGNRTNEVMKVLTIMASVFIPLTFLAGLYGMNFEYMPELHVHWAYPLLLGIMLVVAVAMLFYFRKVGWLGGSDPDDFPDD